MSSLRLLAGWGVCAGYDLGAEEAVAARVGRSGEDAGEARFTVYRPHAGKVADIASRRHPDAARTIGAPLQNGSRLAALTRSFAVHVHRMYARVPPGRPEFVISPEGAFTGPALLSADGRRLFLTVPGGIRAYSLEGPDADPPAIVWRMDDAARTHEIVSCRGGRLTVLGSDGVARMFDERTGRRLASVSGLASKAGRLVDVVSVPGSAADLLVFGGSYLIKGSRAGDAVGYEVVALDPAAGKIAWRKPLPAAPEAAATHGGIWLTPVTAGSSLWFGAVTVTRADPTRAELNLWSVSIGGAGEPVHRRVPLAVGEGEFRPNRIGDNLFTVIGNTLVIADGSTLSAHAIGK
jgi:hypothetical protein